MFAAAGDHGTNANTYASLDRLAASQTDFYLALGDFSYNQVMPESAWCDLVKQKVGASYPFELVSGNHEDSGPNGVINNFANCLPDRIGSINGTYAKEYYFDYPPADPLARIIMISPHLKFDDGYYFYSKGTHYRWLVSAIDDARASGIPWIIVGMHEVCISAGVKSCETGSSLMNLLISKKVDLVLQGHEHVYERSKQLTCASVGLYRPSCVVDDGSDSMYTKGIGTVFVIDGTFGKSLYDINMNDTEAPYFVKFMDNNTLGNGYGFMRYMVSADRIYTRSFFSGTFADSFSIMKGG